MNGDLWGHLVDSTEVWCEDCGYQTRLVVTATNKRLTVKDLEIIAEALETQDH